MIILDEAARAMLDAGKTIVLEGGYIVVTTETLFQVVQSAMLETLGDIMMKQPIEEEANDSSICSMCGGEDIAGTACSSLILETGYGSANDMKQVTVPLCGDCADRLYAEMTQMSGARIDDIQI